MSDSNFLGNTQNVMTAKVISLTKYEIDSNSKGGSVWATIPNDGENPDVIGDQILKIKMPFLMFEQTKAKLDAGEIKLPGQFEILTEIKMGGQNKPTLFAKALRYIKPETSETPDTTEIDKTTGEIIDKTKPEDKKPNPAQTATATNTSGMGSHPKT